MTQNSFRHKVVVAMIFLLSFQAGFPLPLSALTSGPTQPEFNEFEPVGTTQMVDLFSGDFTYNIPLFELPGPDGGYPFNLAYHSGISMDQEASWVGLGWSLNHGAITRTMRGFPDDFDGDEVSRKMDMKPNNTWQFNINGHKEFLGFPLESEKDKKKKTTPPPPPPLEPTIKPVISLGLGLKVMKNSYKGWGLGFNFAPNAGMISSTGYDFRGGVNLGVSSFEGASLQPTLSFGNIKKGLGRVNTSLSINSREGAQSLSLGYTKRDLKKKEKTVDGKTITVSEPKSFAYGGSSIYTFGKSAYSPQVSMPYRGSNFRGSIEGGIYKGIFEGVGWDLNLSFIKQRLQHKNVWTKAPAYGYFNLKDRESNDPSLQDFNREKDGPIRENTPNLANPISTPDIYSVMGQGTGGMYRAYRSTVGIFTDPYEVSKSGGGRFGLELNPGSGFDVGLEPGRNFSISENKQWAIGDSDLKVFKFSTTNTDDPAFEPYYFKAAGELTAEENDTYDYIGGERAVRLKLGEGSSDHKPDFDQLAILEKNDGGTLNITQGTRSNRKPRANSIQPITNKALVGTDGIERLNEYKVEYYIPNPDPDDTITVDNRYDRNYDETLERDVENHPKHIAGITSLQANGMRYVYALPTKNKKQEEIVFSTRPHSIEGQACKPRIHDDYTTIDGEDGVNHEVAGTDKYLSHNVIPEYTHAYLLTSVLGADYIDLDDIPGPSDGDYGYWVKFNYIKTSDSYQWRTPFQGANYLPGKLSIDSDDKASVLFGEREQFYLATAETKTHVAEFSLKDREDGKGAENRHQKDKDDIDNTVNGASYQLEVIKLYSKLERFPNGNYNPDAVPIKQIKFESDFTLCPGVKNNSQTATFGGEPGAKLTLKSVKFTYENSTRGSLSPYQFEYMNNKPYQDLNFDRWGTYREPIDDCDALNFPYTYQDKPQSEMDANASAWHLNKIHLPSGATIQVNYEADDYAYVQDRTAMQMFKIEGVRTSNNNIVNTNSIEGERNHGEDELEENDLKVYFKLENPGDDVEDYLADLHGVKRDEEGDLDFSSAQLFYKILSNVNNSDEPSNEYVSGYAKIAEGDATFPAYGKEGDFGYIRLAPVLIGTKNNKHNFHPFAVAAWQFLKLEFPSVISSDASLKEQTDENSFLGAVTDFAKAFGEFKTIFKQYYRHCSKEEFGSELDLSRSFIRLNTPDKRKYGDASRVKRVTLIDYWDVDGDGFIGVPGALDDVPTYGQVYEYTTQDEDGRTISSGVAANEPSVGYEECALRYAKEWTVEAFLKSDENMFFEYPVNETYYPGASVGYSKVTVKSLATHLAATGESETKLPVGFGTTGVTVNEFYTAKDFPVLVEETQVDNYVGSPRNIGLPPFFHLTQDTYTGTQGYAIILNNMHGKPHKVTHYGMDDEGDIIDRKLSEVVYTYATGEQQVRTAAGKRVKLKTLKNEVPVLLSDNSNDITNLNANIEPQTLGVDYEFFMDMRESTSFSEEYSVGVNVDFSPGLLFGIGGNPNVNLNDSRTRTAVTNKVIRKSGILIQTDAFDGQSQITTSNKVFDPINGEVLLTTVNNSFDAPIYNYNIPARYAYERMGEAYKNWGIEFLATLSADEDCGLFEMLISEEVGNTLIKGDECLAIDIPVSSDCTETESLCQNPLFIFVGQQNGKYLFENEGLRDGYLNAMIKAKIVRSGNRNHLTAKSGSITALDDPTINRTGGTEPVTISEPASLTTSTFTTVEVNYGNINNVLNASAVTYSDHWDLEREDVNTTFLLPPPGTTCKCLYVSAESFELTSLLCEAEVDYEIDGNSATATLDFNDVLTFCPDLFVIPLAPCLEVVCTTGVITNLVTSWNTTNPPGCNTTTLSAVVDDPQPIDGFSGCGSSSGGSPTVHNKARAIYSIGEKGIWRPQRNYAYVTERSPSTASASTPNLATDGTYDNFTLFNWTNPFFPISDIASSWRLTNEITKYASNGEEVENRDIIGLYSTALYGYNDNLPVAVGANVAYPELAFDGFEEYQDGAITDNQENGNFDFECTTTQKITDLTYNIVGAYDGGKYLWIDKPYYADIPLPKTAYLILKDAEGQEYEAANDIAANGIVSVDPVNDLGIDLSFRGNICAIELVGNPESCDLPTNQLYTGQVVLQWVNDFDEVTNCFAEISSEEAHSGSKSLKVTNASSFVQKTLQLRSDRKYVLSAWVKVQSATPMYTYASGDDIGIELDFNGTKTTLIPAGEVINGWQRIEGVFTPTSDVFTMTYLSEGGSTYFDDLRIYPEDGSAQTYVYNPQNYRLRAVLDNNNYATFYHYDAEGNLFLVKKETARGIKTIQETREYVRNTQ